MNSTALCSRCTLLLFFAALLGAIIGCSNTKYLPKGRSLHTATAIKIDPAAKVTNKYKVNQDLLALARPKPNKKVFGAARVKLTVYNQTRNRKTGLGRWLNEKIGEAPVLVDTLMLDRTRRNMQQYMFNHGYFNNVVTFQTKENKQKTTVTYNIRAISPYVINQVFYPAPDAATVPEQLISQMQPKSLIQSGQEFNVDNLQAEINRISYELKCKGYYEFTSKDLTFDLDSTQGNRNIDVYLKVKPPQNKEDKEHKAYRINKVYIYPDYEVGKAPRLYTDTLTTKDGFTFISSAPLFKPQAISRVVLLKENKLYSQKDWEYTLNHLMNLGVFKFVNVKFDKTDTTGAIPGLDCRILLTPAKRMSLSGEVEVNNRAQQSVLGAATSSLLGTAGTISYRNKNLLGGAEAFSINLFGGVELNPQNTQSSIADNSLINTLNVSGDMQLALPKFLVPFKLSNSSRYYVPKTNFRISANYLRRINFYTLNSFNINFGYDWNENNRKRHLFNPISVSLLSLRNIAPAFQVQLDQNSFLRRSFEEQLIAGANYSYIYNTQNVSVQQNFVFFRASIDIAGNTFYALDRLLKLSGTLSNDQKLKILGSSYAHFSRLEADIRYYNILNRNQSIVTRFNAAVGVPYGNSQVLPYIKQYFTGGPNSIRAFRIRSIGPGSFGSYAVADTVIIDEFDRTGDVKLEANAEWRFPMFSMLKGALFVDAGNIWTLKDEIASTDPDTGQPVYTRPNGKLTLKNLGQGLAVGTGFGVRLDFSFFVMRFDLGIPIRNPSMEPGSRWVIADVAEKRWLRKSTNLNLAIGYPF